MRLSWPKLPRGSRGIHIHIDAAPFDGRHLGNLHNVWYRGTVEFRWFEATLHAGRIKTYLQFCLAVAAKALNGRAASSRKRDFDPQSAKYDFRVFLLHLGLIGDEFKTARKHLMANMPGDDAFKNGRPKPEDVLPDETTTLTNETGIVIGTITVLKGNKPLCLRVHRQHRVVLYASEAAFIDFAVDKEKGWCELEVPEGLILSRGTADPLADARRQQEINTPRFGRPTGDWYLIHGELVTFTDPQRDLPPIDRLEGFRPGGHSMYQRVMVAVLCGHTLITAWTYWLPCPPYAKRVASGQWLRP